MVRYVGKLLLRRKMQMSFQLSLPCHQIQVPVPNVPTSTIKMSLNVKRIYPAAPRGAGGEVRGGRLVGGR